MTPAPPATVRPTKPTRQSTGSIPLYSARPPQTPPSIFSVPLRRSCGRTGGWSAGGPENGADVMPEACSPRRPAPIGEDPDPTLVLARYEPRLSPVPGRVGPSRSPLQRGSPVSAEPKIVT